MLDDNNNERKRVTATEQHNDDHKTRHQKFLRQQIHDLEKSQHLVKKQFHEIKSIHISERLHTIEAEQKRLSNSNSNLTRQIVNLDKLHSSMLELLEDVETVQNKVDKTIPDIKREISKFEFNYAQLAAEYGSLVAEGHTTAKTIQAMAVSVSALQNDRNIMKEQQREMEELKRHVSELKSENAIYKKHFYREDDSTVSVDLNFKISCEIFKTHQL